ncbi:right-handed parallel beta-helix repeat-containing protein [Microbacteriaceae bacterium VKM Ac-2854]|nr:right-handed parallel beta-helix repeat-containing protein [Microbacteriaceae bacterium VKM Ac-2854]
MSRSVSVVVSALLVVTAALFLAPTATAAVADRYASPNGSGTACSSAAPCTLATAVQNAPAGATVYLNSGTYPDVTLKGGKATAASPATITAAPGAEPVLVRVKNYVPNTNWSGLTVTKTFYTYGDNENLSNMNFAGGGLFLRSDDTTVRDSTFKGGSSIDGIQVGGANRVLVENNVVSNYDQLINNGFHADCVQVFESNDVTIRGNKLSNCHNAGLIFSPGGGDGMSDILVESNFIQGCVVVTAACGGGSAADLREATASDITIRNNTFANGSLRVGGAVNTTFDRNIVGYLASCTSPMTNTIVASWNTKMCAQPQLIGQQGNVVGSPSFVSQAAGDLHLADPQQAVIAGWGSLSAAAKDIDGQSMASTIAGADSATGTTPVTTPTATPTPAPTTAPTVPVEPEEPGAEPEEPSETIPDTTAPTVEITTPGSGARISGTATTTSFASDDTGVTGVSYWLGTLKIGDATETSAGIWTLTANTGGMRGTFALTARAVDAAGNSTTSAPVTVTLVK